MLCSVTASLAASGTDSAEGILTEEIQKMWFVGKKNVNYVIPGTNISDDLIAVAFLIWDSYHVGSGDSVASSRAAHAEL